jgi:acyl-[acyl carrier protein]--UDP-N-acetylglucosamine O-acyltransferase
MIGRNVQIADNVKVGRGVLLGDGVKLGRGVTIPDFVRVGRERFLPEYHDEEDEEESEPEKSEDEYEIVSLINSTKTGDPRHGIDRIHLAHGGGRNRRRLR